MIVRLTRQHARRVAELHQAYLSTSFRGPSGREMLQAYYESLATSSGGIGFVAVDEETVSGYVCGIWDPECIQRDALRKYWHRLLYWGFVQFLVNPGVLRSIQDRLAGQQDAMERVYFEYELRPIVVTPEARGSGIADRLVHALLADARSRGHVRVELITEEANLAAISFYRRIGFQDCGTFTRSGVSYRIYEIEAALVAQGEANP
jgi:ribosomal protein S18 acetylase RimI-like enzyme